MTNNRTCIIIEINASYGTLASWGLRAEPPEIAATIRAIGQAIAWAARSLHGCEALSVASILEADFEPSPDSIIVQNGESK